MSNIGRGRTERCFGFRPGCPACAASTRAVDCLRRNPSRGVVNHNRLCTNVSHYGQHRDRRDDRKPSEHPYPLFSCLAKGAADGRLVNKPERYTVPA